MKDLAWHQAQAEKLASAQRMIREGETSLVYLRWEMGAKLNGAYGWPPERGSLKGAIPRDDLAVYAQIYDCMLPVFRHARKFHQAVPDETQVMDIINDYGTWGNVVDGFLAGHSPRELKAMRENYTHHIANVPDPVRDGLYARGLSRTQARQACTWYLEISDLDAILMVYRAHQRNRAA